MIGGATVMCIGPKERYIVPTMARPGDNVLITKGAAIEASGLFAVTFPDKVAAEFGEAFAKGAQELFWQMSVVEDALTAVEVGVRDEGVTTMHDATECGVWGGLAELAQASQVGLVIEKGAILVDERVRKLCGFFGIEPYEAISEGTLILTCRPHKVDELTQRLGDKGIPVSVVGEVVEATQGVVYFDRGRACELVHPKVDPFWEAFGKAAEGC
jgi:hydrogenase maturation factor